MIKKFTLENILNFEQRYRATFINSLGGFKSLVLIGTKSKSGNSNLAVFNSLFHLGAHPPMVGFIIRPDSAERHTLNNILETGSLTINHVSEEFYKQAHQTSARYPNDVSEFGAVNLSEEYDEEHFAPFVQESEVKIGAEFVRKINVEENGTIIIIAKIKLVSLPEYGLMKDGFIDLEKAGTITCTGVDAYYRVKKIARLSYAKPNKLPDIL
ncbi:MAG: flavin reductase [Bacteroidota bacterium]|nr:flavin reductase [Bacteroidota bacterium]